jgi:hypothetical protein
MNTNIPNFLFLLLSFKLEIFDITNSFSLHYFISHICKNQFTKIDVGIEPVIKSNIIPRILAKIKQILYIALINGHDSIVLRYVTKNRR